MTEDEASMMKIKLERETEEIQREFSRLLFQLQKSLTKHSSLDDVISILVHHDDEGWTKKCSSISQVFGNAKKFCAFFNTGMVKLLIQELGNEQDKKNYEDYKKKFQTFCKNRVCQLSEKDLAIVVDRNIEKLGKWEQEHLQFEINRVFKNKPAFGRLLSTEQVQQLSTSQTSSPTQAASHIACSDSTASDETCQATSCTTTSDINSIISSEATSFARTCDATESISPSEATGFASEANRSSTSCKVASKDTRHKKTPKLNTKLTFSPSITSISSKILPVLKDSTQEFPVSGSISVEHGLTYGVCSW